METKEQLVNAIKEWVKLDNEIKQLQIELKKRKVSKQKISDILMTTMKNENIDGVDLNNGKEQLCYSKRTFKRPLTKSTLLNILSKYYPETPNKAIEMNNFILENREESVKETIILKKNK